MALTKTPIELSSTPSIVDGGNATAITIDSSERVFIGKTGTGLGTSGTEINPNGYVQITEDQSPPLYLSRLTSDGSIINFYKDTTTVGSIGTGSGLLTIGKGTGNLVFENALVAPCSDSSVGASNGVVDLGASSRRFKDLYLSGGAYLGGTGAANKLQDYETGTWTMGITCSSAATLSIPNTTGSYIKIGSLVTVSIYTENINVSNAGGGTVDITGLPFTIGNGSAYYAGASFAHTTLFSTTYEAYGAVNNTFARVTQVGSIANASLSAGNPKYMMFSFTYHTNQ